jgi:hypothetical protein
MVPGRFDTALVTLPFTDGQPGDFRSSAVARIRCIVSFTSSQLSTWFGENPPQSRHFAYIDWFTKFPAQPDPNHGLYKVSLLRRNQEQQSSMVPIGNIWQSVHLLPAFGQTANRDWKSSNVLDKATHFYVNSFSSRFAYSTVR